jgi:hypothetical protein
MSFRYNASPAQRNYALGLMHQLELDSRCITLQHARYFKLAQLPPPQEGASLDVTLGELTGGQCSALIQVLKQDAEA